MAGMASDEQIQRHARQLFFKVQRSLEGGMVGVDHYPIAFSEIVGPLLPHMEKKNAVRKLKEVLSEDEFRLVKGRVTENGLTPNEYYLTVDAFKAFAMTIPGDNGKKVRRYYIDLEKKYINLTEHCMHHTRQATVSPDPSLESACRILEQKQSEIKLIQSYIQLKKYESTLEVSVSDASAAAADAQRAAEEAQRIVHEHTGRLAELRRHAEDIWGRIHSGSPSAIQIAPDQGGVGQQAEVEQNQDAARGKRRMVEDSVEERVLPERGKRWKRWDEQECEREWEQQEREEREREEREQQEREQREREEREQRERKEREQREREEREQQEREEREQQEREQREREELEQQEREQREREEREQQEREQRDREERETEPAGVGENGMEDGEIGLEGDWSVQPERTELLGEAEANEVDQPREHTPPEMSGTSVRREKRLNGGSDIQQHLRTPPNPTLTKGHTESHGVARALFGRSTGEKLFSLRKLPTKKWAEYHGWMYEGLTNYDRVMDQKSGWQKGSKGGVTHWTYETPEGESCTSRATIRERLLKRKLPLFCEPVDGLTMADISTRPLPKFAEPEEDYIRAVKERLDRRPINLGR